MDGIKSKNYIDIYNSCEYFFLSTIISRNSCIYSLQRSYLTRIYLVLYIIHLRKYGCTCIKDPFSCRYTTRNADGEEVFFCMVQAPYFTFNLSVVNCKVINILDVRPVTKTRHETLISHVVQIDPQNPGDICSEVKYWNV